jgi:hypothetical protein
MGIGRIFLIPSLVACFWAGTPVNAKEISVPKEFKIAMEGCAFSIAAPIPPDNEFVTYRQSIPIYDSATFKESKRVVGLNVHWTYRSGLLRKVAGVIELKVMIQLAESGNDVTSDEGLQQDLLFDFKKELVKIGYKGDPVQFDRVDINGHSWVTYRVPFLGVTEYSTGLSESRYLTARFSFIDNTGEQSPAWRREAGEMMESLVKSMRVGRR